MYLFNFGSFVVHFFSKIIVHFLLTVDLLDLSNHGSDHSHNSFQLNGQGIDHLLIHERSNSCISLGNGADFFMIFASDSSFQGRAKQTFNLLQNIKLLHVVCTCQDDILAAFDHICSDFSAAFEHDKFLNDDDCFLDIF